MKKQKYLYDPANMTYEEYKPNLFDRLSRLLGFFSTAVVFAILLTAVFETYFESSDERRLKREISTYEIKFKQMREKVERMETVLGVLQQKDNQIYRAVFGVPPKEMNTVRASIKSDKYKDMEDLSKRDLLVNLDRAVRKLRSKLYILSTSYDTVKQLAANKNELLKSIPAIRPIKEGRVSSGYGWRLHPILGIRKLHKGIDFSAQRGTPIYATGDGRISTARRSRRGYGNQIVISHGFGYQTRYAHLSRIAVRYGQKVKRGEIIGYVGSTGRSTAPHLHYEVVKNDYRINPINFFHGDLSPEEYDRVRELASRVNTSQD